MPMDFPDFDSLKTHAKLYKFRPPSEDESEDDYRNALADHVRPLDLVESMEIRTKVGWDKFTTAQHKGMLFQAAVAAEEKTRIRKG